MRVTKIGIMILQDGINYLHYPKLNMMRIVLLFLSTFFVNHAALGQETVIINLQHQGNERNYRLFVPSGYDGTTAMPVVFNLHGVTSNATQQEFYSNMNSVAEENDFFVCYPNGIDAQWNVGFVFNHNWDDVDFIALVIDDLAKNYNIDESRVYSCGMSNGGFMSYKLGCELNNKIAAIASVTGSMVPTEVDICQPDQGVPVMQIHGTADPTVSYSGTAGINIGIEDLVSTWLKNNDCQIPGDTTVIADTNTNDASTAIRIDYNQCTTEAPVVFYRIDGGEHTWPGAILTIGITNQDFDASTEIWNFFKQFSLDVSAHTKEVLTDQIKISPNPSTDYINIRTNQMLAKTVEIYNLAGLLQTKTKYQDRINVSALDSGIYFLKIETEEHIMISKFVKI